MTTAHRATWKFLRPIRAHPRLTLALATGAAVGGSLDAVHHLATRLLLAWNTGAVMYLILALVMMVRSTRAHLEFDGRFLILGGTVIAGIATLGAIGAELGVAKDLQGWPRITHIGLAALTVFTAWAFIQVIFALHYAHDFYRDLRGGGHAGGLTFPGTETPDYLDFLYFACVIGTSGQTADVSFTGSHLRRIGLLHCVLAYFFNATLLALTINLAASLL